MLKLLVSVSLNWSAPGTGEGACDVIGVVASDCIDEEPGERRDSRNEAVGWSTKLEVRFSSFLSKLFICTTGQEVRTPTGMLYSDEQGLQF